MNNAIADVCTLPASELETQIDTISREILSGVSATAELEDGYELTFPGGEVWLRKLTDFIAFERKCCSDVFRFELICLPSHGPLLLRIRGNDGIKEQLQAIITG